MAGFFTNPFRGYLGARKDLRRIARALERIADRLEGRPLPAEELPLPERGGSAVEVGYGNEKDYARAYRKELDLTSILGRQPTSDEIIQALEDEDQELQTSRGENRENRG